MATRDLDEGRLGGFERQHALLCQIHGMLESAAKDGSDCPTPTPDQTSIGSCRSFSRWHREAAAVETARKQHRELALVRAVPAGRSTKRPCGEASHSSQATWTGGQRRKG